MFLCSLDRLEGAFFNVAAHGDHKIPDRLSHRLSGIIDGEKRTS
ncbi:hypothetical protein ABID47_005124 [Paenibacillus favisporus]|uniref:Uncharacterized protein n=1 Tax=Paenibacillus favisporus TaxID=221028 RepID=A0ABV2F9R2_9BACL